MPRARVLVVAAAALAALLVVWFVAQKRRGRDGFYYAPTCGAERTGRQRAECRGITTGVMPSIETMARLGNGRCCGRLGVPP